MTQKCNYSHCKGLCSFDKLNNRFFKRCDFHKAKATEKVRKHRQRKELNNTCEPKPDPTPNARLVEKATNLQGNYTMQTDTYIWRTVTIDHVNHRIHEDVKLIETRKIIRE